MHKCVLIIGQIDKQKSNRRIILLTETDSLNTTEDFFQPKIERRDSETITKKKQHDDNKNSKSNKQTNTHTRLHIHHKA